MFEKMCSTVNSVMIKIFDQPFNRELAQGLLPQEKFIHYLQQDALYLADFSRALAITAARLTCNEQAHHFIQFSLSAIHSEQHLHRLYLKKNHAPLTVNMEQSPACFMYTNYLLKMASTAAVEEAVASLLPCFWVYREVGKKISQTKSSNNPYESWIELYSGEAFDTSVKLAIEVTNALSEGAPKKLKEKMLFAFLRSTQLEWLFWESAYQQEQWFSC
ncbi:MAG: TenA family protein [Gammaproteobacteria bacterium]|nr:TenA family protein [Gammaproteobacteria bacterium]